MTAGNPLSKKLVKLLNGTHKNLRDVCEDLGIDYDDLTEEELPINRCTDCGVWSLNLVPDLDDNPICPVCVTMLGL
jgi:hypothetical protein